MKVVEAILSLVKIENYVPEYMAFYKRALEVRFLNQLIKKFSVIFPFEGLFYSRRVHQKSKLKQAKLEELIQINEVEELDDDGKDE